jgi:excinuclease ABC subunit C
MMITSITPDITPRIGQKSIAVVVVLTEIQGNLYLQHTPLCEKVNEMERKYLAKKKLPDAPGVYRFMRGTKILYIGKATSLRDRAKSYFANDLIHTRGSRIVDMVTLANRIVWTQTGSVLEALLLEAYLIKTKQPKYNVMEKDDKSDWMVVITDEKYPRVLMLRKRDLEARVDEFQIKEEFGPFTNGLQLREAMAIMRKLFPYFDTRKSVDELDERDIQRMRLNVQIGIYPDVFSGKVSAVEYRRSISWIKKMFEGKIDVVRKEMQRQMKSLAKGRKFEEAAVVRSTLFALDHIRDVSLLKQTREKAEGAVIDDVFRIEAYDASHLSGTEMVGVMVVVENGELAKNEYRKFNIDKSNAGDDIGALKEVLRRRMNHAEWRMPDLIVIDGGETHRKTAVQTLEGLGIENIPVVSVVKDERHKAKDVLGSPNIILPHRHDIVRANDDAHRFALSFQRRKRRLVR